MNGLARSVRFGLTGALLFAVVGLSRGAEVLPPKPADYFNDYAGVVSREAAQRFDDQLKQFERDTSNQVVVAVFQKMETDSDIADYTQRIAQAWGVGQGDRRNGTVLFVFIADRKMFIQVGYGLEGALPDATAFDITERRIKPHFRTQDYEGGLAIGIESIGKAINGEYIGTGRTNAESNRPKSGNLPCILIFFIFILFLLVSGSFSRRKGGRGWIYTGGGGGFGGGGFGGDGGGGWSGGSSSGGGISGGGGSFGGGGAGSSW